LAESNTQIESDELLAKARSSIDHAYARYSHFPVAAAVLDDRGLVFTGVNVENASFGLTMCAERVAIFSAIANGARKIRAVAVTSSGGNSVPPCGACRQVMAEFCEATTPVYFGSGSATPSQSTMAALLPHAFGPSNLSSSSKDDPTLTKKPFYET
jgi:cytidine deaminase